MVLGQRLFAISVGVVRIMMIVAVIHRDIDVIEVRIWPDSGKPREDAACQHGDADSKHETKCAAVHCWINDGNARHDDHQREASSGKKG